MCRFDPPEISTENPTPPEKPAIPRRVILLLVVLALLRGLIYVAAIPPWQSPDEHGHFEYAWLVSQHGPFVGPASISLEFQQRVLASMYQFDYWRLAHQPMPETLPTGFTDPDDRWLVHSRPQVGDERPLYYLLVGGLLWLANDQDVVTGLLVGRIISVLLYTAAVGVAALTARSLFPQSPFMQVVPPAFLLFLPMMGEMGAAVNSDAIGLLTGTLFFASLVPVLRDGLTWRRAGMVALASVLALISKKTALFLVPAALLALAAYGWTRGVGLPQRLKLALTVCAASLLTAGVVLGLIPGGDAANWVEQAGSCKPTRLEGEAFEEEAALQVGACADWWIAQAIPLETAREVIGRPVTLNGWVRSAAGPAVGWVTVQGTEGYSQLEVVAEEEWRPFVVTHTVETRTRWLAVRLAWGGSGGPLLFDGLKLSAGGEENLLVNASAEQEESLLFDLLSDAAFRVGAPRLLVERMLAPQSWSSEAWQRYVQGALFCFRSFWGLFGSQAVPLPPLCYQAAGLACILALAGNLAFLARRPHRRWQAGYLFALMGGLLLLVLQTLLPMVGMRGTYWLPQGRYLFPGLFAIAVLLAWGFYCLFPRRWERWGTPAVVGLMAGFDLGCLGFLIVPYFYGG